MSSSSNTPPPEPASKVQTPSQYLAQAALWTAGINLVLNVLAGWLIYRKEAFLPLEGAQSVRADATGMIFIIVSCSLFLAVPGLKKRLRSGQLLPYERAPRFPGLLRWMLGNGLPLGLLMALASVFAFVPLAVWILSALNVTGLALWPFLAFKSLLAALVAATVVPLAEWLVILIESGKK
jgi:hypothetical protein